MYVIQTFLHAGDLAVVKRHEWSRVVTSRKKQFAKLKRLRHRNRDLEHACWKKRAIFFSWYPPYFVKWRVVLLIPVKIFQCSTFITLSRVEISRLFTRFFFAQNVCKNSSNMRVLVLKIFMVSAVQKPIDTSILLSHTGWPAWANFRLGTRRLLTLGKFFQKF
jgi:hypothetical protein